MHKLIRQIEDKAIGGSGQITVHDISLKFISEEDGQTQAEYHAENGTIKKEEKEWTIMFETDGELHTFPIEYAYEADEKEDSIALHFDYEDDEYVIVQFRF